MADNEPQVGLEEPQPQAGEGGQQPAQPAPTTEPAQQPGTEKGAEPSGEAGADELEGSEWFKSLPEEAQKELRRARDDAGKYRSEHRDLEEWMQQRGGKDYLEKLHNATQTHEGVMQLFFEAGKALGVGTDRLESIFGQREGQEPSGQSTEEDEDGDTPMTKAEARAMLKEALDNEVRQPLAQQRQEQLVQRAHSTINKTLDDLGVTDDDERQLVVQMSERFTPDAGDPREFDPDTLAEAIRKGHQAWKEREDRVIQSYLERKKEAAGSAPGLQGGASPSLELPQEPKSAADFSRMLRERGIKTS